MARFRTAILWLGLLGASPALAMGTEVVELYYRSAPEMITLVKPHLEPGETVSGLDSKLVLRLRPEHRETILALVKQLDQRPAQLLVSVRQGGNRQSEGSEAGVAGRYRIGPGGSSGTLSGRIQQDSQQSRRQAQQQVRVMDGQPATFYVGRIVPVPGASVVSPDGYIFHDGVYYQEVMTGFVVRPRLRGQQVLLEVSPQTQSANPDGSINTQFASTTVEVALGQWVEIGAVVEEMSTRERGLASAGRSSGRSRNNIQVLVEDGR